MKENSTFHSQNLVLRLALLANITAWALLIVYLLSFISDARQLVDQWPPSLPTDIIELLTFWAGFLFKLFIGAFYFVILQGVAQLMYLGLDVYMDMHPEDDAAQPETTKEENEEAE